MSDNVQFDMDQEGMGSKTTSSRNFTSRSILGQPQVPAMATWLMKHGVKSESTAKYTLVFVVILSVALTFVVYFTFLYTPPVHMNPNHGNPPGGRAARLQSQSQN